MRTLLAVMLISAASTRTGCRDVGYSWKSKSSQPTSPGYRALMGADEGATVRDLKGHQAVIFPIIGGHGGRVIDTAGDGILAEFGSVVRIEPNEALRKSPDSRGVRSTVLKAQMRLDAFYPP